jgi:hypothetical protein
MAVNYDIITRLFSSVGNIEGTLSLTNIHLLRQIYSELYDITCLINDTGVIPYLASICWILTAVLCCLYEILFEFNVWGVTDTAYTITCTALIFKVRLFCHKATNEAKASRILVQKLLFLRNYKTQCVKELEMFFLQLQKMTIEYTACGFLSLNLSLLLVLLVWLHHIL